MARKYPKFSAYGGGKPHKVGMCCDHCGKELTPADIPDYQDFDRMGKLKPKLYFRCKLCREGIYKHKDIPVSGAVKLIDKLVGEGNIIWVKFTCHNCLSRQTVEKPNAFFTEGISCQECGRVTVPNRIGWAMAKRMI